MFEIKSSLFLFFEGHYFRHQWINIILGGPYHVQLHSENVLLFAESTSR